MKTHPGSIAYFILLFLCISKAMCLDIYLMKPLTIVLVVL